MAQKRADRKRELQGKSEDQLKDELSKLKKEQFNLRFQAATGQLEKTHRVEVVRRDIATVRTLLQERAAQAAAQ